MKYHCFYSGVLISAQNQLSQHIISCEGIKKLDHEHKVLENVSETKNDDGNAAIQFYNSIVNAYRSQVSRKIPCDMCTDFFESESMLELHKMFSHPEGQL